MVLKLLFTVCVLLLLIGGVCFFMGVDREEVDSMEEIENKVSILKTNLGYANDSWRRIENGK